MLLKDLLDGNMIVNAINVLIKQHQDELRQINHSQVFFVFHLAVGEISVPFFVMEQSKYSNAFNAACDISDKLLDKYIGKFDVLMKDGNMPIESLSVNMSHHLRTDYLFCLSNYQIKSSLRFIAYLRVIA